MKISFKFSLCLALLFMFGCAKDQNATTENSNERTVPPNIVRAYMNGTFAIPDADVSGASVRSASHQSTNLREQYPVFNEDVGSANLTRNADGLTVNIKSDNIAALAGHAVTLWWIVFDVDAEGEAVFYDAGYANGKVIGNNGKVNISAHLDENDTSSGLWIFELGLNDAENQGIHVIVRSHGPKNTDCMPSMIQTLCSGCAADGYVEQFACDLDNDCAGPNTCQDWLDAIFYP